MRFWFNSLMVFWSCNLVVLLHHWFRPKAIVTLPKNCWSKVLDSVVIQLYAGACTSSVDQAIFVRTNKDLQPKNEHRTQHIAGPKHLFDHSDVISNPFQNAKCSQQSIRNKLTVLTLHDIKQS